MYEKNIPFKSLIYDTLLWERVRVREKITSKRTYNAE